MARRGGLGRGLDSLFPNAQTENKVETAAAVNSDAAKPDTADGKNTEAKVAETKTAEVNAPEAKTAENTPKKDNSPAKKASVPVKKANPTEKKGTVPAKKSNSAAKKNTTAQEKVPAVVETVSAEQMMKISKIEPNRDQPRREFNEDALQELAESITNHGIIQPIVVRKKGSQYEIVAGERRWRAARLAGLKEVPVIIKDYTDTEIAEIALVENLQREDLNPIEEAMAYQKLLTEFELKQEEVAFRVSKSRTVITNSLRLLKLPEEVQQMISEGTISTGHGKVLLSLDGADQQKEVAARIAAENLSVRQTEDLVHQIQNPKAPKEKKELANAVIYKDLENKLCSRINSKVSIHRTNEKKGKIEISYTSLEELERIIEELGVNI